MIELTRTTSQKLLFEGKHGEAVPAAMQSLRFAIDIYGLASIELVPSYLILGEACTGQKLNLTGRFKLTESYWLINIVTEPYRSILVQLKHNISVIFV